MVIRKIKNEVGHSPEVTINTKEHHIMKDTSNSLYWASV